MKQALITLGDICLSPQFFGALFGAWIGQISFAKRAAKAVFKEEHAKAHNFLDTGS